ncbi:unnamed protein product [Blepharisma stoltei]|uniref:Uncharacterized protein n=1 Tax=Blepharisma stoltei TaxID=1481888 RepID=A0AAU9JFL1_9CILI|nr:unnamed protein product [Blepharisma stoltei]
MKNSNRSKSTGKIKELLYSPKLTKKHKVDQKMFSGFYINEAPEDPEQKPYEGYEDENFTKPFSHTFSQSDLVSGYTKRTREALIKKVYCLDDGYKYTFDFSPALNFFKFLCVLPKYQNNSNKLELWVPDTIIYNDIERPYWIYSDHKGRVCRGEHFEEGHIISKLSRSEMGFGPVAVLKKVHYDSEKNRIVGNNTQVLNSIELIKTIRFVCRRNGEKNCLQKFIRCKGSTAFICRNFYSTKKAMMCYLISSKVSYTGKCYLAESADANILKVSHGYFVSATGAYTYNIIKFLERNLSIKLEKLVCDYIKDEEDIWWMINVKAFKYSSNVFPTLNYFVENDSFVSPTSSKLGLKEYKRLKRCEFCRSGFVKMTQELTLKMLFELEEHLKHRGKELSWMENKEYRHVDNATLYQRFQVCESCFNLYTITQELKNIEISIAKGLGFIHDKEAKEENNLSPPLNFNMLEQYRFMLILDSLRECEIELSSAFHIRYSFLGSNIQFSLTENEGKTQSLKHVKSFYIFAKNKNDFEAFLENYGNIVIELYNSHHFIGKTTISLYDFHSINVITKVYYQPISISPNIYLQTYTGITRDGPQKVSAFSFNEYKGIYLPRESHTSCHTLPAEWFEIMPNWYVHRSKSSTTWDRSLSRSPTKSLYKSPIKPTITRSKSLLRQNRKNRISYDSHFLTKTMQT